MSGIFPLFFFPLLMIVLVLAYPLRDVRQQEPFGISHSAWERKKVLQGKLNDKKGLIIFLTCFMLLK